MATANRARALMQRHAHGDTTRFFAVLMQAPVRSVLGTFAQADKP